MVRRVYTYPDEPLWNTYNLISSIGSFIMAVGLVLVGIAVLRARRHGLRAGNDPWLADTLEWYTTSPPPAQLRGGSVRDAPDRSGTSGVSFEARA